MPQRAVVWVPVGEGAPAALLSALARRSVHVTVVSSGLLAVAHACVAERDGESSGPPARGAGQGVLVILVDPARLPEVSRACAAVARFAPRARCWCFEAQSAQSLRPVTDQDLVNWGAVDAGAHDGVAALSEVTRRAQASAAPVQRAAPLRLASGALAVGGLGVERGHDDSDDGRSLSAEELRMLLGRGDGDSRS